MLRQLFFAKLDMAIHEADAHNLDPIALQEQIANEYVCIITTLCHAVPSFVLFMLWFCSGCPTRSSFCNAVDVKYYAAYPQVPSHEVAARQPLFVWFSAHL